MTDWAAWHAAYEDPQSSRSQRLDVVTRRLNDALNSLGALAALGALDDLRPRILSLCAGDGRDVVSVLSSRESPVARAVLVERDEALARRAATSARVAGLSGVEVRCADAGAPASFADVLPVDVLLLCGVFGNMAHERVRPVVEVVPRLVAPGGFVVWTRGGSAPDRRPEVRRWFAEAGMDEVAFDGEPAPYGVGLHRLPNREAARGPRTGSLGAGGLPERLFSFDVTRPGRPSRGGRGGDRHGS